MNYLFIIDTFIFIFDIVYINIQQKQNEMLLSN